MCGRKDIWDGEWREIKKNIFLENVLILKAILTWNILTSSTVYLLYLAEMIYEDVPACLLLLIFLQSRRLGNLGISASYEIQVLEH